MTNLFNVPIVNQTLRVLFKIISCFSRYIRRHLFVSIKICVHLHYVYFSSFLLSLQKLLDVTFYRPPFKSFTYLCLHHNGPVNSGGPNVRDRRSRCTF